MCILDLPVSRSSLETLESLRLKFREESQRLTGLCEIAHRSLALMTRSYSWLEGGGPFRHIPPS